MVEFSAWPKTPRFMRDICITEKIDGSNSAIGIAPIDELAHTYQLDESGERPDSLEEITILENGVFAKVKHEGDMYGVYARARPCC